MYLKKIMAVKKTYIAVVVVLSLLCLVAGMGWLTTEQDLRAAQIINEQYAYSLKEAKSANETLARQNNQLAKYYSNVIGGLEKKLDEAKEYGSYWWDRAHPREFEALERCKAWLAEDDTDSTIHYIFGSGSWTDYDCDDYSVALVRNAREYCYEVSTQIDDDHMRNSTIIGNEIYYIEPETDEVWLAGYRDKIK